MAKKKNTTSSLKIRDDLAQKEKEYYGKDDMLGMTLLTNPSNISASRSIMYTSHLNQMMTLKQPQYPLVFTNYENVVGKFSSGRIESKSRRVVTHKVPKFDTEELRDHIYTLFLYDEEKDKYHTITKKPVEDLTEKFGYEYNTDNMDSKRIGDVFEKGEVIQQTTSYDDVGNYSFGINANFVYLISNDTIEDAVVVSESLNKQMMSTEVEAVTVSLNDNDIFVDIYGDGKQYQGFPDIGQSSSNVLCARRRIQSRQLLFDIKSDNLKRIDANADTVFYCKGTVVDIDIYCNKTMEELEENKVNAQLIKYLRLQNQYYERILEVTTEILESGSKYSSEITYLHQRAKEILDPEVKWKEDQSKAFSNMVIEFLVSRNVGLEVGQKITGRYGNKGVISQVRPDNEMPIKENGERIDVIFNALGVVNRLNSQQLFEQSITFIMSRVRERMFDMVNQGKSVTEALELLTKMVSYFSDNESEELKGFLDKISDSDKEAFYDEVIEQGMNIHIPPMLWNDSIYSKLKRIYSENPWIDPYRVYIQKFGRYIEMLNKLYTGSMYIIKLKQSAKKGLSVRSTGHVSHRGLPEKTKRSHRELYSKTPIRFGGDENSNMNIGVESSDINILHMFHRSSVHGRQSLAEQLTRFMTTTDSNSDSYGAITVDELFETNDNVTNRNVEILNAYSKILGFKLVFEDPASTMMLIDTNDNGEVHELKDGSFIIGSQEDMIKGNIRIDVIRRLQKTAKDIEFMTSDEYNEFINAEVNRIYDKM